VHGTLGPPQVEAAPARGEDSRSRANLLPAIAAIARLFGRPVGADAILAGLPVTDGVVSPVLFARAAANAGLASEPAARPLDSIPNLVLPAVLLQRDGSPLILLHRDAAGGQAQIVEPGDEADAVAEPRAIAAGELAARYSGYCFLVKPEREPAPAGGEAASAGPSRHWFWSTLRPFAGNYLHIALASLLVNLLALAFPLFVMNVYDRVVPNGATASLTALAIGVVIAFAFDFALRFARSKMIDLTGKQIDVTLAARIFAHAIGIRLAARPASPGATANQIREFESVREFFTSSTVISASDTVFALVFVAVMFVIVGPLAWIPLLLLPVTLAIGVLLQKPLDRAIATVQAEQADRHGLLVESLHTVETIRALGAENRVQAQWERSVAETARASEAVHQWSALTLNLSNAAQNLASLLVVVCGVLLVLDNRISVGALVAATMLSGRIFAPIANLAAVVMRGARTLHTLRAIDRLMALPVEREPGRLFVARKVERGEVAFQGVSLRYPGTEADALSEVSFAIAPGERVGIVGRIGSGKTTVGRLLAGFYAPTGGRILVDGIDLRQYDPVDLRRGVGFALQDTALFRGSLRDNIAFGSPGAGDDDIVAAARLAGVEDFAGRSTSGYELPILEGGRNLSGGQRQAVALARVLLRKPAILFLDEPTSALDLRSEAEFCERLTAIGRETTLIVSTHRVSLLRMVDRLIVFDAGRIVADGPRTAILAKLQGGLAPEAERGGRR
jgi:ATP-binding cassette subfamily C protein LapB